MKNEALIQKKLESLHQMFDEQAGMIAEHKTDMGAGYHTRRTGIVHGTNISAEYAAAVICIGDQRYFGRVNQVFSALAALQDTAPDSPTFGLWPYYMEEDLGQMLAPDYNFSDFIGKHFIYALTEGKEALHPKTQAIMRTALQNAMECSVRRNVSPDYSNISMMSCMTIISAGELLGDVRLFHIGKERLKKAYAYNLFCGAFSEYNSSTYTPLAIAELTRMLMYFQDAECRQMAQELHDMAWENISLYYNSYTGEISPPQKRAYRDLDDGQLQSLIYFATDGKHGMLRNPENLLLSFLTLPFHCPEKFFPNFTMTEPRWLDKTYYKRNHIRTPDEDTVIVRNIDSPDLKAYTYMTQDYSAGAFDKTDLWNQRRTSMVTWGTPEAPRCLRLRCINGNYDYCSGVARTEMRRNIMLTHVGFVSDHGDFHYILDKKKDGTITTDRISFRFELNGATENVKISRSGDSFLLQDGEMQIHLSVYKWVFDGKPGEIILHEQARTIELLGYAGEERTFDFNQLQASYGVFALAVMSDLPGCDVSVENGKVISCTGAGELRVQTYTGIKTFDEFMALE